MRRSYYDVRCYDGGGGGGGWQWWPLLHTTSRMYDFFFTKLESAPVPKRFPYEIQELIRVKFTEMASPLRRQAAESYQFCLSKSQQVQWFNEWTRIAEERLGRISPESFRDTPEMRSAPNQMSDVGVAKGLILKLEPREELVQ